MGGGTGTGDSQYTTMTLKHPWGDAEEQVRVFPPCCVSGYGPARNETVIVYRKIGGEWERKQIDHYGYYPQNGFVAWDDTNHEYAWHQVGTIDVPSARDPKLKDDTDDGARVPIDYPQPGKPTMCLMDHRHTSKCPPVPGGTDQEPRRKRRTFLEWFLGKSPNNSTPDFLRRKD